MQRVSTDDWQLWLAMAAVALFYHYATANKLPVLPRVLSSLAVSILAIGSGQGWIAVLLCQALLYAGWELARKRGGRL